MVGFVVGVFGCGVVCLSFPVAGFNQPSCQVARYSSASTKTVHLTSNRRCLQAVGVRVQVSQINNKIRSSKPNHVRTSASIASHTTVSLQLPLTIHAIIHPQPATCRLKKNFSEFLNNTKRRLTKRTPTTNSTNSSSTSSPTHDNDGALFGPHTALRHW